MAIQLSTLTEENRLSGHRQGSSKTWFFGMPRGDADETEQADVPQVFLARTGSGVIFEPHFHFTDQFQFFVGGTGLFGKRRVGPGTLQYAKANSPYGPLVCDDPDGMIFFTVRPRYDPGPQYMPGAAHLRKKTKPHSIVVDLDLSRAASEALVGPNEDGLAMSRRLLAGGESLDLQVPHNCGGLLGIVLSGSLVRDGDAYPQWSCLYGRPGDAADGLKDGGDGLDLLVLTFRGDEDASQ